MKIRETFENRKKNGQKALVTYIVSGDYGYETTKENIRAMVKAGADVIEIGIPFSDPIAEGCLLYTSPSPRDSTSSRMPSSA